MKTKFSTFIDPFLETIDNGSFFRTPFERLYQLIALLNLIAILFALVEIIKLFKDASFREVIFLILLLFLIAFACWLAFQLWWNRANKLEQYYQKEDDFVATPVLSHFIQTLGEWIGIWISLLGVGGNILIMLFLNSEDEQIFSNNSFIPGSTFMDGMNGSISAILWSLIAGFLIIVVSRFIAEQSRAIAAIANNTKKEGTHESE